MNRSQPHHPLRLRFSRKQPIALAALMVFGVGAAQAQARAQAAQTQAPEDPSQSSEVASPSPLAAYPPESLSKALEAARNSRGVTYPDPEATNGNWFGEAPEFYVSRIDKNGALGQYRLLDDGRVRLHYGWTLPVVEETDDSLFVLVERYVKKERPRRSPSQKQPETEPVPDSLGDLSLVHPQRLTYVAELFTRGLPRSGQWRNDIRLADMNGDGRLDIVAPPVRKGSSRPSIFLNGGNGNWQAGSTRIRGQRMDYGDVEVGDFDGDGHVDIALAMHLLGTTVLSGVGPMAFEERAEGFDRPTWAKPNSPFGKRAPWSSRALTAVDIDNDGDLDLVAVGEGAESMNLNRAKGDPDAVFSEGLTLYENRGDTWLPHRFQERFPSGGTRITSGNFDDDDRPEVAVAWAQSNGRHVIVHIDPKDGGGFEARLESLTSLGPFLTFVTSVASADLIPGGTDEIVTGRLVRGKGPFHSRIEVHQRNPDGTWKAFTLADIESKERIQDIETADLDADGHVDLVATTSTGRLILLRGTEDGRFQLAETSPSRPQFNCEAFAVAAGDLDGKPGDELVLGFASEQLNIPGLQTVQGCRSNGRLEAWRFTDFGATEATDAEPKLQPIDFRFNKRGDLIEEALRKPPAP